MASAGGNFDMVSQQQVKWSATQSRCKNILGGKVRLDSSVRKTPSPHNFLTFHIQTGKRLALAKSRCECSCQMQFNLYYRAFVVIIPVRVFAKRMVPVFPYIRRGLGLPHTYEQPSGRVLCSVYQNRADVLLSPGIIAI
jgi:hypothetical protein